MKIIQFWRLAPWFLCGILVGSGCTSRQSETVSLDAINQTIADSLKRHNISFVVQAINQGKREARDSDTGYCTPFLYGASRLGIAQYRQRAALFVGETLFGLP